MTCGETQKAEGMNVGVWLSKEVAPTFRRHVPKGEASAYGARAIEAQLRRDGLLGEGARVADVLKTVPAELVPLLIEFAELLAARQARGADAVKAMLVALKNEEMEAAAER